MQQIQHLDDVNTLKIHLYVTSTAYLLNQSLNVFNQKLQIISQSVNLLGVNIINIFGILFFLPKIKYTESSNTHYYYNRNHNSSNCTR